MLRQLHKFSGLLAALLVSVLAVSGAILSVVPAMERAGAISVAEGQVTVAELAGRIAATYQGIEEIERTPAGTIIVHHFENDRPAAVVVDPNTGQSLGAYERSSFERWTKNLHRSLFLGDGGRVAAALGAAAMLLLTLTGLQMTARRMGGWRHLFGRARGSRSQRLHVEMGRLAAAGLLLSALTALYMSAATFGLVPSKGSPAFDAPVEISGGPHLPIEQIQALQGFDLSELRDLTFPDVSDPKGALELKTIGGSGLIDPATGAMVAWQDRPLPQQIYGFIRMLHTGQGLWWLGLILGITSLSVPLFSATGAIVWWSGRQGRPRIAANAATASADTIILVGSEGGSTWGFAATLHKALADAGHKVHAAPMDKLAQSYPACRQMFILAATYGNGEAPANSRSFLDRIEKVGSPPAYPVAVLGFGDRQFPKFCQFSRDVESALARNGWRFLMPAETINRQCPQEFARWGQALSAVLGKNLVLDHRPGMPRTNALTLVSRRDYGAEVQAPTATLRFAPAKRSLLERLSGRGWPRFDAGDLIGIVPPGCTIPRYYSLASSSRDGFLEICVRKHPGGLCSGYLHALRPGDTVAAFIKPNPSFRPMRGKAPVILIGAGTGVGPLAGTIRANDDARPMHLYFGARDPGSDFLYQHEIERWLGESRLTSLRTTFSRVSGGSYVQDRLREDAGRLRALVAAGAQIMVCGGGDMAAGVMAALTDILAPANLDPIVLKAQGRYVEDVF
ncbi:sulfite reductase (NADPH) flavoprotein alpha-component [Mycoplana sp. BE70]|uniref:PepSY domain-containing protein n=1 Tax=Mycoplana sp. BE70 TaxID=2817775 RepID=UPI00285B9C60|nr:PepSY domain-containing protein [Mycoplana sp. BE70]MDR6756918.1 sulfite reductase (NADPH) flavoprotein alpha-component [Mycoplana sp. BE70]